MRLEEEVAALVAPHLQELEVLALSLRVEEAVEGEALNPRSHLHLGLETVVVVEAAARLLVVMIPLLAVAEADPCCLAAVEVDQGLT